MGRGMFLTCWAPMSWAPRVSLPWICSNTAEETQIAAGGGNRFQARGHIDRIAQQVVAAFDHIAQVDADAQHHLVVGAGLALADRIASWISSADRTASTGLTNSASKPSPVSLKMRPRWSLIRPWAVAMCLPSRASACSSSRADIELNPTTSMSMIVVRRRTSWGSVMVTG